MLATVPRKKPEPTPPPTEPVQINLKMSAELLGAIDALVEEVNRARPWPKMTRSDLIRVVMGRMAKERPEWLLKPDDSAV